MESRPRVLVTAFAPVPGTSPHCAALMAMLDALRAEIDFVTVKTDVLSHVERIGEGRMFRVPVGDGDAFEQREAFDRAVARQLEAERYDVVHVRGPFEGALAAERKRDLGFLLVYEMATFPDEALGAGVERVWMDFHQRSLAHADLVLVPTEAAKRSLAETHPAVRVEVIPPGVDVDAFDWRPATNHEVPRILYIGGFTADRDLPTVLEAVRRVRSRRPVQVLLAGEPDRSRRDKLRQIAESFGLGGVVEIRGEPSPRAIAGVIAAADICLAPAAAVPRFQALGDIPQPLFEYMACRRPVVAAAVPGLGEALRDEREGLLYPPGDDETLATSILDLLESPKTVEQLTDAGYRRVRETFSIGARRRRLASIYATILPGLDGWDPWVEDFEDEEIGPSPSEIEAAEAALRGEFLDESTSEIDTAAGALPRDIPEVDAVEPIDDSASSASEAALLAVDAAPGDPELPELVNEPTSAAFVVGPLDAPPSPRIDTDPGQVLAEERTRPGS